MRAFQHSTKNKHSFDNHRLEVFAHILLCLNSQLGHADSQATSKIIIFSMNQGVSERKVVLFILVAESFSLLGGIINDYGLGSV
jgi:hypothetical protein